MAAADLIDTAAPETSIDRPAASTARLSIGAGQLGASKGFQLVFRLVTSVVLARLLEPRDFGLLGLIGVVMVLLQRTMGDGGTMNALVQRKDVSRQLASSVYWFNVAVGVTTTLVIVAGAPWISRALGDESATDVLRAMALTTAIIAFAKVPMALLRRAMRYRAIAGIGTINAVVTGAVAIPLAVAGHGVASMVIGQLVAVAIETVVTVVLAGFRPLLSFRRADIRAVSRFARNMTAFNIVNYLADSGDKFIVGRFVGTSALGIYSLPYRVLFAPVFAVGQVYRELLFPVFSRYQDDNERISSIYLRTIGALSFVTFPLCALTAVLAQPLVNAALGPKWTEAGPILSVMAIVALQQSVLVTGAVILNAKGRPDLLLRWGVVAGIGMFACYGIGVRWGVMGVSVGFLVGTTIAAYPAMAIPFSQLGLPVRRLARALLPASAATLVMSAAAMATRVALEANGSTDAVVAVAGASAGAICLVAALGVLRPPAIRDLLSMARRRA